MEQEVKHISETIERAVEGLLRFACRFLRTFWILLKSPQKAEKLFEDDEGTLSFTRPYTFLAIGGFFFTLVFTAFPHGLAGLIDIIWFSDEVTIVLRDRWNEVLTISGLLLAGVPILFTVPALSTLYGVIFLPAEHRSSFNRLTAFCFGYQTLTAFMLFYIGLTITVAQRLFPVINEAGEVFSTLILVVIISLTVTAFTNPIIALSSFQSKHLALRVVLAKQVYFFAVFSFVILTFVFITYTASIPGAARAAFSDPPVTAEVTFNGDPNVLVIKRPDGSAKVTINADFIVDNARNESLIASLSGIEVLFRVEMDDENGQDYRMNIANLQQSGKEITSILLPREGIDAFSIAAETELDLNQVESLEQDNTATSNHYHWYLVIQVRSGSDSIERSIGLADHYINWKN